MQVEQLTLDPDGRRASDNRLTLGYPEAFVDAGQFVQRTRSAESHPAACSGADRSPRSIRLDRVRQTPKTDRESAPNVLQPGVLSNSALTTWLTRASTGSPVADLAVKAASPGDLVDSIYLRFVGRMPTDDERAPFVAALGQGFPERLVPANEMQTPTPLEPLPQVTWSNHLGSEANTIQQENDRLRMLRTGTRSAFAK